MRDTQKDLRRKILGRAGERRALRYLKRAGLRLLERNWHTPFGEADLVMRDGEETVFVEVKLRSNEGYGAPAEAVDRKKRERYRKMAFYRLGGEDAAFRFDVVEVCGKKINHIRDAF